MTTYSYKALTAEGVETKGVVQAQDEYTAVRQIKQKFPIVTSLTPVNSDLSKLRQILSKDIGSPRIKTRALALMCSQFSITLQSGMPIGRAIDMISKQTEDKKLRKILMEATEDVLGGSSLTAAFEKYDEAFPLTFLETIRAGEVSGTLENSFDKMHKYYERSAKNSEKIRSALTYPIFVVCVAFVVLVIIMVKVIPTMSEVFSSLGGELPLMTRMMIGMADFLHDWWIAFVILVLGFVIFWKVYTRTEKGRVFEAEILLRMPVLGKINVMNGSSQFANTMSTMLASGLTLNNAVSVTSKVLDNYLLQMDVKKMIGRIEEGKQIGECIKDSIYFPDSLKDMCSVGEETGELDRTLETIGDYFAGETERLIHQAITMLEPTLLVIMAIFAGFLVVSVYLPMFTMYDLF